MSKKWITILLCILVLASGLSSTQAQTDAPWRVEDVRALSDMVASFANPSSLFAAPDGVQIAYENRDEDTICTFNITTNESRCVQLYPESGYDFPSTYIFPPLQWSPDSTRLALVGVPYRNLSDTDLGIADFTDLDWRSVAEDGYVGSLFNIDRAGTPFVEVSPAWSPDGTQIAVERNEFTMGGDTHNSTITLFDLADESQRDLSLLPGHEAYPQDGGTVLNLAWSPDGSTLAATLRHADLMLDYDGVWLFDVRSGEATHLITFEDATSALQVINPGFSDLFAVTSVIWSPDGSRLMFWAGIPDAYQSTYWCFWLELADASIHAVPLLSHSEDQETIRLITPRSAVWSPNSQSLLVMANNLATPEVEAPVLYAADSERQLGLYIIDVESEDAVLLGYLPQTIDNPFSTAWSADGNVIAGGYAFRLTQ
ncbi:MAG: PD40 domain-containing protein [Chloroflexi bacterium]|nr:PD40 domain-containing protein [Chloroflexota bacterium]